MRLSSLVALVVSGSIGVLAFGAVGCGNSGGSGGSGGSATGGSSGGSGGAGGGAACSPDCAAVKGVKSECVAITDNSMAKTYGLRMAQLTITKPDALTAAKNPVVAPLISQGVLLNLKDCNLNGKGTFSWILQFDSAAGKLKTGGSPVVDDPTQGYCFVNKTYGMTKVAPITVDAMPDATGKFSVAKGGDVVVPIFLTDPNNPVLLPLSNARLINATLSADHNCIGKYNADKLDPTKNCQPQGDDQTFTNGGTIDAYITLEAADTVPITDLKETMCVLLTGENDGATPKKCKRDAMGNITSKGDWCSKTDMAADATCADAFKLQADFAASAVKITGDCAM
jgi:hypothetical protein